LQHVFRTMTQPGKLIAIEGIDGSGKRTQTDLLSRALAARAIPCRTVSFPRYDSFFGVMIGRFLNGEFGPLEAVDPHFASLLYAGNRLEAKSELDAALAAGTIILADRYVASNMAHQGSRVVPEKRSEFLAWLRQLEYRIYALPAETLVVYLRLKPAEAQRLVSNKTQRAYTTRKHDLLESNLAHLEQAALVYDSLAMEPNWVTIECFDAASETLKPAEQIHHAVLAAVEARVLTSPGGAETRNFAPTPRLSF
jgi:dTMP kinase